MLPVKKMRLESKRFEIQYNVQGLSSVPIYDETQNVHLDDFVQHIIVDENLHRLDTITRRLRSIGIPIREKSVAVWLNNNDEFVQIGPGWWECRQVLVSCIENFILSNKEAFNVSVTRPMPEMEMIVRPFDLIDELPRYSGEGLNPNVFSVAVIKSIEMINNCNLVAVNNVIVNFKEAFIKDIYNVLLRERGALGSLDIALRLFDSKVGVYKKSLKDFIVTKKSNILKIMHHTLNAYEMLRFSKLIEKTIDQVMGSRKEIFIRLENGLVNSYRNHVGIIKIKLTDDDHVIINMANEIDVCNNVKRIIDANRAFLNKLSRQFRASIDPDEIESRFFEKLWQAVVQYDDVFGHKFHTFLHRALTNILLDEKTKAKKDPPSISLNSTISDKNNEELGSIFIDREHESFYDPSNRVSQMRLIDLVKDSFDDVQQKVIFLIMDGYKDRDIATTLNKSVNEISSIKRQLSRSRDLRNWFYPL